MRWLRFPPFNFQNLFRYEPETSVDVKLTFSDDKSKLSNHKTNPQSLGVHLHIIKINLSQLKLLASFLDVQIIALSANQIDETVH